MRTWKLLTSLLAASIVCSSAPAAFAGPFDLDDDESPPKKADPDTGFGNYAAPVATIKPRTYTLTECLALTDRNHPNLWAARARVSSAHAQLDEAKWLPFWQWNMGATAGIAPPVSGTPVYTSTNVTTILNAGFGSGWQPFSTVDINGVIPLYTFGKIDAGRRAAEAQVRVNEWDMERVRNLARMDVRRAYFGLQLARDAKYVIDDAMARLGKAIEGIGAKLDKGDGSVDEIDKLRLLVYRDEVNARAGEAKRGETYALAALRFFTGVQSTFDIPDEPLKRPDVPLAPVVRYLAAARIFRPEVAQARAAVVAREALVDLQRARFFPDVGIGLGASYGIYPSITTQGTALVSNPNHFALGGAFGARWSLDILPNAARVQRTEAELEESRATLRFALGGIAVEVENAYAVVLEAKNREESWNRAEHRSKQWISTVQDAIDLGTKNENSLNEPLRVYINARVSHMYALMDFNVALSDLARVSGWDAAAPTGQ